MAGAGAGRAGPHTLGIDHAHGPDERPAPGRTLVGL